MFVTGDLVQDDASGYLRFRSIFGNLEKPVLCIPGQSRRARRHAPGARQRRSRLRHAQVRGWQFVMLDSYDPGHVGGRLTRASSIASTVRWPSRRRTR